MIDTIRARYPHLGVAVYAYEPGGLVTVEVFTADGTQFQKTADTALQAFVDLFGPEIMQHEEPSPDDDPFS